MNFDLIMYVFALVLFILAGISVPSGRYGLGWLGAACVVAAYLF